MGVITQTQVTPQPLVNDTALNPLDDNNTPAAPVGTQDAGETTELAPQDTVTISPGAARLAEGTTPAAPPPVSLAEDDEAGTELQESREDVLSTAAENNLNAQLEQRFSLDAEQTVGSNISVNA